MSEPLDPLPEPSPAEVEPETTAGPCPDARRRGLVVLEVLAGVRSAPEAAELLGMVIQSYYVLEERAVAGLIEACVPRPSGPRRNLEKELEELTRERDRLRDECARYQALVRASQKTVGLAPAKEKTERRPAKTAPRRKKRPTVRALRAIHRLESTPDAATGEG